MIDAPRAHRWLLGALGIFAFLCGWQLLHALAPGSLLPGPLAVPRALWELTAEGKLLRHVVASLFRVGWGFLLAGAVALPFGAALGWYPRLERAFGPLLQLLRPISPLAWTPLVILWIGLGDAAAVALIFIGCFGPLTLAALNAVRGIPEVHLHAGRNFGRSGLGLFRTVVIPAGLPALLIGVRQTAAIAWTVVVMAEMMAVTSGLGFLILDARNAGDRYDLVFAGMAAISVVGLLLDRMLARLATAPAHALGKAPALTSTLRIERRRFSRRE